MTLFDLLFLASALFLIVCVLLILISATRSRFDRLRWWTRLLLSYLALYSIALLLTSLLSPRRVFAPGQRRCWDDWCATAVRAVPDASETPACPSAPDARVWLAQIQVSSVAKRVRQREMGAWVELEDQQGADHAPCASWLGEGTNPPHALSDPLGPGESFPVLLPFQLPTGEQPVGIVVQHDRFPGLFIIGDDNSVFHRRALQRISVTPES